MPGWCLITSRLNKRESRWHQDRRSTSRESRRRASPAGAPYQAYRSDVCPHAGSRLAAWCHFRRESPAKSAGGRIKPQAMSRRAVASLNPTLFTAALQTSLLIEQLTPIDTLPFEHHHRDPLRHRNFFERIPVHQQQIRFVAFLDHSHPIRRPQQLCAVKRRGL
jgi:hypothetical protein